MAKRMQRFALSCASMGAPVRHQVSLPGAPLSQGVDAWVYTDGDTRIGLIADTAMNTGVSATNGFEAYATAVCGLARKVPYALTDLTWYEFDSMGRFDEVHVLQGQIAFRPLREGQHGVCSAEAFLSRIWRTAPGAMELWRDVVALLPRGEAYVQSQ